MRPGDLLQVADTATVSSGEAAGPVFLVGVGDTLTAGGAYLNSSGTVTLGAPVLELAGGNTGTGPDPLLRVVGGTLTDSRDSGDRVRRHDAPASVARVSGADVTAANVLLVGRRSRR